MNAMINYRINESTKSNTYISLVKLGAVSGLLIGIVLLAAGIVLSALAFFENVNFNNTEVIMIVSSFTLLGFGAHWLDLLEKDRKARRRG